uniref:Tyrosine-protein phosphatase domain-containing protein n=1 Tax=Macrostomum lignano TaxID=282301 RepID=A0A1I8FDG1_9PLAT
MPCNKVLDRLYVGSIETLTPYYLTLYNIRQIVSRSATAGEGYEELDLTKSQISMHFDSCALFTHHGRVHDKNVLVHCNQGVSRARQQLSPPYLMCLADDMELVDCWNFKTKWARKVWSNIKYELGDWWKVATGSPADSSATQSDLLRGLQLQEMPEIQRCDDERSRSQCGVFANLGEETLRQLANLAGRLAAPGWAAGGLRSEARSSSWPPHSDEGIPPMTRAGADGLSGQRPQCRYGLVPAAPLAASWCCTAAYRQLPVGCHFVQVRSQSGQAVPDSSQLDGAFARISRLLRRARRSASWRLLGGRFGFLLRDALAAFGLLLLLLAGAPAVRLLSSPTSRRSSASASVVLPLFPIFLSSAPFLLLLCSADSPPPRRRHKPARSSANSTDWRSSSSACSRDDSNCTSRARRLSPFGVVFFNLCRLGLQSLLLLLLSIGRHHINQSITTSSSVAPSCRGTEPQRHVGHLDNLEPDAGDIADGVAGPAKSGHQHFVVLLDKVQTAVVRHESGDLLAILDQLNSDALPNGTVRLLGFNADLLNYDALGVGRAAERVGLPTGA